MASDNRRRAIAWWNKMDSSCQGMETADHYPGRQPSSLTGLEIEHMWILEEQPTDTDTYCKICDIKTPVGFNIDFKLVPICECCAEAIFIQQASFYVKKK